jgi:hypothetical protein
LTGKLLQAGAPTRVVLSPLDRQAERGRADLGVRELLADRVDAVLIDQVGDLGDRDLKSLKPADARGGDGLVEIVRLDVNGVGGEAGVTWSGSPVASFCEIAISVTGRNNA